MNREELEQAALAKVCACWYYDLQNSMDETYDGDLERVIANPAWFHISAQLYEPQDAEVFKAEYDECRST